MLVLLSPIGLDAGCWDWVELPVDGAERYELPGVGARPAARAPLTMEALARQVAASYPGPLDLVGASFGGMIAQHVALHFPDRVRSLFLLCTNACSDRQVVERRAADAEESGMGGVLASTLGRWFTPQALAASPEPAFVRYAREALLRYDLRVFAEGWRAMSGHQVLTRLTELRVPTTCLAGAADVASPPARSREMVDRLPEARLRLAGGPHMLVLEEPAAVSAALEEHFAWVRQQVERRTLVSGPGSS